MLDFLNIEHLDDGDIAVEVYRADLWDFGKPGDLALKKLDRSKIRDLEARLVEKIKTFSIPAKDQSTSLSINTGKKLFAYIKVLYEKTILLPEWKSYFSEVNRFLIEFDETRRKFQSDIDVREKKFQFSLHIVKAVQGEMQFKCGENALTQVWVLLFINEIVEMALKAFPNLRVWYHYDQNYGRADDKLIISEDNEK